MCQPLVSVVIPVYNGANYLRQAIDSVLMQTYLNIEIIVVNDGSTDNGQTEQIARSYGNKIRYFYKDNGGVASALNVGIHYMKGEYFSWLSHDDVFYPEKIQHQIQLIEKEKVRMTACAYNIFYDSGRRVPVPFVEFYGRKNVQTSVFSVLHALIQFGGVLFHRDIFSEYGTFREDLRTTQDYEFLFRVLREEKCSYSNEILYGIRYHSEQGSNTISSINTERDEMYQMFIKKLSRIEKKKLYGSVYNFYYQMLLRVWPMPHMAESIKLCLNGLDAEGEQKDKKNIILQQPILIYGAGIYGRRILFDLRCRGGRAVGFLDGNQSLWGKEIDGVICYSLQEVKTGIIEGTIIIASIFREEIAQTLREYGINSFYFKEEYEQKVMETAPERERIIKVIADYGREQKNLQG